MLLLTILQGHQDFMLAVMILITSPLVFSQPL